MKIDKDFIAQLFKQAEANPRRRQNCDLRTSPADTSQRMLNALLPDTVVPIHQHDDTTETVICLVGKLDEIIYRQDIIDGKPVYTEAERITLCPADGHYGCQIPQGAWHTVEVHEPSIIFEAKDGAYKG